MLSGICHAPRAGTPAGSSKAPSGTGARTRSPTPKPPTPAPQAPPPPASPSHARLPPLHPRGHEHRRGPAGRRVAPLPRRARPPLLRAARRDRARRQPERDALPRAAGRAEGRPGVRLFALTCGWLTGAGGDYLIASTTFVPAGGSRSTAVVSSRRAIIM